MPQSIKKTYSLSDLADVFMGNYSYKSNYDINKMREEIMDISIVPTPHKDKENLRTDLNQAIRKLVVK